MNQGRLALLLLILSIKAVQSLILISIFMWFKLIRETLIKREMRHIRGWALQNHHHPHQRGLREMDVFNHQDELFRSVSYSKNENDLLTLTSHMTKIQKRCCTLFSCWFWGELQFDWQRKRKKPTCTQRKSDTCSLWQLMEKAGIDIFSDRLFRCISESTQMESEGYA